MSQRKMNISRWYLLGLAAVLTALSLIAAVGTTLARYRVEQERTILFEPKSPVAVALGTLDEDGGFVPDGTIQWKTQPENSNILELNFAVSNYITEETCQQEDLEVRIRLVGSLAAWSAEQSTQVFLTDGTLLEDDTPRQYTAEVMQIPENTALYHSFGVGWIFRFLDENGQELTWKLEGGTLSCAQMNITMDASALSGTSLLQLQIVGQTAE